jgi:hypothetical protein
VLRLAIAILGSFVFVHGVSADQTLTATKVDTPPPDELAPTVKALMTVPAAKVQAGPASLEFWWVKPLEAATDGWARTPEGSLVGAVRVSEPYPDIRGRRIKPGVYTLRFALQPMNGDHLGVSPHREFLLVSPAAADLSPAPIGYQGTIDLSKQTTGASHPAAWSLDPPSGAPGESLSNYRNEAGHEGIVFEVQTATGSLKFGLILIGKIEA